MGTTAHCVHRKNPLKIRSVAGVVIHLRRKHKCVTSEDIESTQAFVAQYGYWYCKTHKTYNGTREGKPSPNGMRPYTYSQCIPCRKQTTPMMFRAMHHSQLVHDGPEFLEPEHSPPNESKNEMDGESDSGRLPSLHEVCATHIPVLTHIPLAVKAEIAQIFRRVLQCAVDAAESKSNIALDC